VAPRKERLRISESLFLRGAKALVFLPPPQSPSAGRGRSRRSGRVSGGVSFLRGAKWHSCFSHPLSPPPQGGGGHCAPVVLVAESLFLRGAKWHSCLSHPLSPPPQGGGGRFAPVFFQLCGILTFICYSSTQKGPFASFLGTIVMCFKSFPLQLSATVCMCMAVVKFGGHVVPAWSAVWAIRRGFCGRLPGRGHGTYLQRSF